MSHVDGRSLCGPFELETDVVVVGSGPAGSAVAREAARAGARVVVVEAGPSVDLSQTPRSAFGAMSLLYRGMGASVVLGSSAMPYVQGRMVGGSSPINGAICWRMPREVHGEWCDADPALAEAIPWATLEQLTDEIEERLGVAPTDEAIAGRKNLLRGRAPRRAWLRAARQ